MCHGGFKIRGLGSGPLLKMRGGGLSELAHTWKGGFGATNNKETYICFLKRRFFSSCTHRKGGVFLSYQCQTLGGLSRSTYPYCPNMGVTPPPRKLHCSWISSDILRFQSFLVDILSPVTDKCPFRVSGRERMNFWSTRVTFEARRYVLFIHL